MAFGLTIGTDRATTLQNSIQDELIKRGFSAEADPVMAEYITIMIINNKTPAQISSELEDLIGSDFDTSFVDWLFAEAAKGAPESEAPTTKAPEPAPAPVSARDSPPHLQNDSARRGSNGPRNGAPLYQQALNQAIPNNSPSAQKRTASARSPSPSGHPNKSRRTDLPTGPRAMQRDGHSGPKSLLDRMGPSRHNGPHHRERDEVQARIDNITGVQNPEMPMMMGPGGFPMNGMPGMDMSMASMANPMALQEMMVHQMALMAQMAGAMGILNPAMLNGGFPMQPGVGGDMGQNGHMMGGQQGRGRGRGTGGRGGGRGRGGHAGSNHADGGAAASASEGNQPAQSAPVEPSPTPVVVAPTPVAAPVVAPAPVAPLVAATLSQQSKPAFTPPERPQSPTLCKFGLRCTNPLCRWSHPSPVATPESGVVLSNEACENGKDCKDKDCIKAHVSPAVLNPNASALNPKAPQFVPSGAPPSHSASGQVPCRFGTACTRPNCAFLHPARQNNQPCRFGTACTRANCTFQHPEGRVLPSTFHRGLSTTGGLVNVSTPETGSMGASPHRSMTFNKPTATNTAAELEKKVKEVEEKKNQAEAAVAQAQAAAATKKDDNSKPVTITA